MQQLILNYSFDASIKQIYPHFMEFEKFGELHPFFTKVTRTGHNMFHINESVLLFGFIPMNPRYMVEVLENNGEITYRSNVRKGVDLEIRLTFLEDAGGKTLLTEEVNVRANRIIAFILLRTIKKAHIRLFERLQNTVNPQ
jgi:hypothetical protein